MLKQSRKHLTDAGESYLEHMHFAFMVSTLAIGAGLGCLIHAFIPGFCQRTCSQTVERLQYLFEERRRLREVQVDREGVLTFVGLATLSTLTTVVLLSAGGLTFSTSVLAVLSLAIPGAYLATNRELDPPAQQTDHGCSTAD